MPKELTRQKDEKSTDFSLVLVRGVGGKPVTCFVVATYDDTVEVSDRQKKFTLPIKRRLARLANPELVDRMRDAFAGNEKSLLCDLWSKTMPF